MVTAFDKREARSVMERMIESLKDLGVELNVTFSSAGGRIDGSRCTFKVVASKLDTDGSLKADRRTDTEVRWALESEGVKVDGDVMGSIWRKPDGTLVQIVNYHRTRSKYPFEIKFPDEERTKLTTASWFKSSRQVTAPSAEDFHFWLRVDPDLLSPKDTERYDTINDWLTLYVPESKQDAFFDTASRISEGKVTARLSQKLLSVITQPSVAWDAKIHQLNQIAL